VKKAHVPARRDRCAAVEAHQRARGDGEFIETALQNLLNIGVPNPRIERESYR
jgi:hypothetical protein